jgi:hypothetical protein
VELTVFGESKPEMRNAELSFVETLASLKPVK